ncbi:MAG: OmpA family protein [Lachnospiraceae bacterium]|nr:OmpA family protein [Lachnospiraceae bacterium]
MGRNTHHRKQDEETNYWLSYSDMMAGLLLTFVLIIAVNMLHSKVQFDAKQEELAGKEQALIVQSNELAAERSTVADQQALLDIQQEALNAQQQKLTEQEKLLADAETTLRDQHALLDELSRVMSEQQAKLDNIIGIRQDLIEALQEEFRNSNLQIAVDEKTGAITFDSSILFEYNEATLTDKGKEYLSEFLPRYVRILMSPEYKDYVSEIIIEGHTDSSGTYLFNLELSQERAYSVAEYCLSDDAGLLNSYYLGEMRRVTSTTGRSWSDPVYRPDGTEDDEASRRVEFLFRLKDEEMVREMIEILSQENG